MQFLDFVNNTSDIETFEKGDLTDNFVIGLLFDSEVVMSEMTYSLETVREGDFGTSEEIQ